MGEKQNQAFQLTFNGLLKVDFQGSRVTLDGGPIRRTPQRPTARFQSSLLQPPQLRLGRLRHWERRTVFLGRVKQVKPGGVDRE